MSKEAQQNDHETTIRVLINGEPRELSEGLNLSDLIRELALAPERIAIELNHEVVRRTEWSAKKIADGDQIEMVHFVGGGVRAEGPRQ